jgi:hypothetical protein
VIGRITSSCTRGIGRERGLWKRRVLEEVSKAGIDSVKVNKSVRSVAVSFAQVEYIVFDVGFETTVMSVSASCKGISADQEAIVEPRERLATPDSSFRVALFNS